MIARHIARYGIVAGPENVLITAGSQQPLDPVAKLLINPGDRVLVEAPTYLGALQAFNLLRMDGKALACVEGVSSSMGRPSQQVTG